MEPAEISCRDERDLKDHSGGKRHLDEDHFSAFAGHSTVLDDDGLRLGITSDHHRELRAVAMQASAKPSNCIKSDRTAQS